MYCLSCGYDLSYLTDRVCPECGRRFSPDDSNTWQIHSGSHAKALTKYSGWAAAMIAAGVGGYVAFTMLLGHGGWFGLLAYWMLAAVPLTVTLIVWVSCLSINYRLPSKRAFIVGSLLMVFNVSLLTEWPMHISFLAHQKAFQQQVQSDRARNATAAPSRIGLYQIHGTKLIQTANGKTIVAYLIATGSGPDYLVHGATNQDIENHFNIWSYTQLSEDWHIVHED